MIASRISSDIIQLSGDPASGAAENRIHEALQLPRSRCRVGEWKGESRRTISNTGMFARRVTAALRTPSLIIGIWMASTSTKMWDRSKWGQQTFNYEVLAGEVYPLKQPKSGKTTFELKVKVVGQDGIEAEVTRCVTFTGNT